MVQRTAQKPATSGSKKTGAKPHSGLDRDALLKAYEKMSRIRAFEDRLHEENATGDIPGFIHLYSGQEAIAVGVCENLSDADYIGSTHRGHGHCIAKGCDLNGMMAEIFGKDDGLCRGKGGSMHRRPVRGNAGCQCDCRRSPVVGDRRCTEWQDTSKRRHRSVVHGRRWIQPGNRLRGDEHGCGAGSSDRLRDREQRIR